MFKKIAWVFLLSFLWSVAAQALTVLQLNIEQLTALSDRVFAGRCVDVREITDVAGRPVQEVTFDVEEMIKGEPSRMVTFRQLGYSSEETRDEKGETVILQSLFHEMPRYQEGEEAIIFLSANGPLGLTAPIGLFQGKFTVETNGSGKKQVVNGLENRGLFVGLQKSLKMKSLSLSGGEANLMVLESGALPYNDFVSLVKKIVQ